MAEKKKRLKRTDRGFAIYGRINDLDGRPLKVVRSSAMGPRAMRVYVDGCLMENDQPVPLKPNQEILAGAHLDVGQARWLMNALRRFVEGEE